MKGVYVDKKLTKSWKSAKSLIDLADVRIFPKLQCSEVLQTDVGSEDKLRNILNYVNTHKIHETRGRLWRNLSHSDTLLYKIRFVVSRTTMIPLPSVSAV